MKKPFVFDECFNDKRIIRGCNNQDKCIAQAYPVDLKGKKDHEMLPGLLKGNAPLVTIDNTIITENLRHIPNPNSGVIIVFLKNAKLPIITKLAAELMSRFKERFPDWHLKSWGNVCLEISEVDISIISIPDASKGSTGPIPYDEPDFAERVSRAVEMMRLL